MSRALAIAAALVVLAAALVALVAVLSGRDDAGVPAAAQGPGTLEPDHGARHLPPNEHAHLPPGALPTSGPHHPVPIRADRRPLSDDQILHALELGDVVIAYAGRRPAPALVRLQREVAGRFDPALAAAGQAVVLVPRDTAGPATALAWRRLLRARSAADPALRRFAEAWLGRGARRGS